MYPDGLDERAALLAHHCEAAGDKLNGRRLARARRGLGRDHAPRPTAWATGAASATWRAALEASPERDELATKARVGILSLAWRLGISPEETAAIHAEAQADAEQFACWISSTPGR